MNMNAKDSQRLTGAVLPSHFTLMEGSKVFQTGILKTSAPDAMTKKSSMGNKVKQIALLGIFSERKVC